jgi:hypothetical protein
VRARRSSRGSDAKVCCATAGAAIPASNTAMMMLRMASFHPLRDSDVESLRHHNPFFRLSGG